ncbi:MAG: hypothetical protein H6P99_622 [Holophagaceae bacterium]|nr:hypothetical protein [Holophagaceae bacterium]
MKRLVEIRTYQLKPGSGARFHDLVSTQSVPLLRAWGMEVVTYGRSLHAPDGYYLIRAYDDLAHLHASQDAFYASDAWRQGPREAIIELILTDANAVLWLAPEAVDAIRRSGDPTAPL